MSDQSSFIDAALSDGNSVASQIRLGLLATFGKARLMTNNHLTGPGPYTFAGGLDLLSFDTTSAGITINLPAAPLDGDTYEVVKTVAANTLTVGRNGKTINGAAADDTLTGAYSWKRYTWNATANTWLMRS